MAKIYGTPIMAGGAGGMNKDLPPLLDNFKAKTTKLYIGEGNTISKLPSGSKVKLGSYNGQSLKWIVARDTVTQELRLVLDKESRDLIGPMMYDNQELSNPDEYIQLYGNIKYSVSNIHQWLNSDGAANEWYTAQHEHDAPPDYQNKAGFLNEWTVEDKSILQKTNWVTNLVTAEGGDDTETVNANLVLISSPESGINQGAGGNKLDIFDNDDPLWQFNQTFLTRNPYSIISGEVMTVDMGYNGSVEAKIGSYVCPICAPNPNTIVSETTDEDGCYTIGADGVELSANKMEASRANELAGAVWVYGDHEPESVNDGTKIELTREDVIQGGGEATVQKTIQWNNEANFFARQFTYNSKKQYQTMREGAIAKIYFRQSITELPSGSKVKLGTWNDTPLQWKVARDTSDQSIRLVLEPTSVTLLGNMQWDAPEPSNSNSTRRSYGNNRYIYSNIHQWINSDGAAGSWYTAQHSADAAPDYSSQAGFLSGWSENHIAALDRATLTVSRSSTDGGGTETFVARVALISTAELGLQSGTGGGRLDIFNSDGDRSTGANYWTRTPNPSSSNVVGRVSMTGTLYMNGGNAYSAFGVRPLCIPKSTALVSMEIDDDNCYVVQ